MRQFYLAFPICDALRHELGWTHYRILMPSDEILRREIETQKELYRFQMQEPEPTPSRKLSKKGRS